jgi:hypothetical protein
MQRPLMVAIFTILNVAFLASSAFPQAPCSGDNMSSDWIACHNEWVIRCVSGNQLNRARCENEIRLKYSQQNVQPGGVTTTGWHCPATHLIKGNFTTYDGERCIFHVPGGQFYEATRPEKCYRTPQDAIADGCRQSER